jgi:hypothetical protein
MNDKESEKQWGRRWTETDGLSWERIEVSHRQEDLPIKRAKETYGYKSIK